MSILTKILILLIPLYIAGLSVSYACNIKKLKDNNIKYSFTTFIKFYILVIFWPIDLLIIILLYPFNEIKNKD